MYNIYAFVGNRKRIHWYSLYIHTIFFIPKCDIDVHKPNLEENEIDPNKIVKDVVVDLNGSAMY